MLNLYRFECPGNYSMGFAVVAASNLEDARSLLSENSSSPVWNIDWSKPMKYGTIDGLYSGDPGVVASFEFGE